MVRGAASRFIPVLSRPSTCYLIAKARRSVALPAEPYERPRPLDDHSAGTCIKTAFSGACKRAGITNFTPHSCRHTWATWHYAANRDLIVLMRLGGWNSERMGLRYAHV